ncbi:MAG: Rne/Rng family ribonuclease [Propionibacteriales bacterium]|nr:Rne/Rng family ribonuclease [Propionibacteriales bacterium]
MLDTETPDNTDNTENGAETANPAVDPGAETVAEAPAPAKKAAAKKATKKAAAKKTAKKAATAEPSGDPADAGAPSEAPAEEAATKPVRKRATKKAAAKPAPSDEELAAEQAAADESDTVAASTAPMVLFQAPAKPTRKRAAKKTAAAVPVDAEPDAEPAADLESTESTEAPAAKKTSGRRPAKKAATAPTDADADDEDDEDETAAEPDQDAEASEDAEPGEGGARRRRRRGGRRRRKGAGEDSAEGDEAGTPSDSDDGEADDHGASGDAAASSRRRTRTRAPRPPRNPEDEITSIGGSTRLEAKKQRRREGREAGRRRAPIVSEAEFLARREAVDRVMVIRQRDDLTQIAVLEDKVLVEHYAARNSQTSLIGNIYLGRVQNVLPSMEAAFIDIGKGRNAVLYAGEVNWSALGHVDGQPRKVESVLKSGQTILVQVTKDPVGHKGARLTGQISLPGRFLVYVPDGNTSGISRKLPDTERNRLKTLLKEIVPDTAGVIVRTAAEGASEEELTQDVERLTARWADIESKVKAGKSPELLYGEPDLTLKVVRDLFTEDFKSLVIEGDDAWDLVDGYVSHVAPDLRDRLQRYESTDGRDIFGAYRIDEQIAKGLDRKVWLPSGGSLVIDRTEAMTVVDVNTGKFTGSGGNLEETVTKNNLEAAEEMVRQLRLRDIGGIIVIDFIDMVLESNRDLVLRRLVECLGRDRTRHQVAEVTSLGLVQMTRKRIGSGLIETFSEDCDHCKGRGIIVHEQPIEPSNRSVGMGGGMGGGNGGNGGGGGGGDESRGGRRNRGGRGRNARSEDAPPTVEAKPSPMALAGTKPHPENEAEVPVEAPAQVAEITEVAEAPVLTEVPEVPAAEVAAVAKGAAGAGEAAEQDGAVVPPTTEAVATAPVVVTTTRRRRAARPAGPGTVDPAAAPAAAEVQPPVVDQVAAPEPDAAAPPVADPVVAAPVVVTTTRRRRAAGRPAGPAVAAEGAQTPADGASHEPAEAPGPEDGDGASPVFHVPVKKKGTRKR